MDLSIFIDLMWYFKTRKLQYIGCILVLILVALLGLIPPSIVGRVVDGIQHHTLTRPELIKWLLEILIISLGVYGLRYVWRILLFGSAIRLSTIIRGRLFNHFTNMSPEFYHNRRIGDLMAHATNDVSAIEATASEGILTLVDSLVTGILVILTMSITISWKLTIVSLLPMPLMAYATSRYGAMLHKRFRKAQAAFSDINDKVQENISGVRVIKAFGQEEVEKSSFTVLSQDVVDKNMAVAKVDALFDPTISIVVGLSYFLSFAVGAVFVIHHHLTIGGLTSFSIYLGQLIWPMLAFGFLFNIVQRGRASYDRVSQLLAVPATVIDKESAVDITPSGRIVYDINQFTYPGSAVASLENVHVPLERGQTLGLVGKTGSGKTTLLKLLLREFDVTSGDIRIGEHSIYDVTRQGLRGAIGYVPQDHFLFSASIAENIAFACPDATMPEIHQAAKIACIHDDILNFEDGYGTMVGERGVTLSGGQKQRISIARALLMDAEILILDDSLSAVDAKTEAHILESLRITRANKTTMIATHRLSAIEHADLILVLEEGKIVERGTHKQLLAQDGWYADMYQRQQLESLVEQGGGRR